VLLAVALAGAAAPPVLEQAEGGLWEIDRPGSAPMRLCVGNPASLANYEQRGAACSRAMLRQSGSSATIHYTCRGGGFGHSTITVLTPRSLRVETQGIAANAPFNYTFQARRVGNCPSH